MLLLTRAYFQLQLSRLDEDLQTDHLSVHLSCCQSSSLGCRIRVEMSLCCFFFLFSFARLSSLFSLPLTFFLCLGPVLSPSCGLQPESSH